MNPTIRERYDFCRNERILHVHENSLLKKATDFISGDGEVTFANLEDLAYYERLTGHIEELKLLIAAGYD